MLNNDFLGNPTIEDDICPQEKDYNDAKMVADKLGISQSYISRLEKKIIDKLKIEMDKKLEIVLII